MLCLHPNLSLSWAAIIVGCAINYHDASVYNKTLGFVVHSSRVMFVKTDVSLGGNAGFLCVGVEIPPDSVGRVRWIHPFHWGTPCGRRGRTMLYIGGALTATRPLCWSRDHQVHSENKLVELQSVWEWRCCTWASARGTEFPARAEFPPWTPESPSLPESRSTYPSSWWGRTGCLWSRLPMKVKTRMRTMTTVKWLPTLILWSQHSSPEEVCHCWRWCVCSYLTSWTRPSEDLPLKLVGQYYANTS